MKARLVVFPIRERRWCFSRSGAGGALEADISQSQSQSQTPSTLKDLWNTLASNAKPFAANAELVVDFVTNKMNKAWVVLEKAPHGSLKNKIHGLGSWLLSRVKPSEIFLKSISKEVNKVEITYPSSLNARLVRRRLRHVAMRGVAIHKRYFYGSVLLLPLTSPFMVLPLPNIPFFWILFRSYSNWRALKGSEKLLQLVSDCSDVQCSATSNISAANTMHEKSKDHYTCRPWVLLPSNELERLLCNRYARDGLTCPAILDICKTFDLNKNDVLKYRKSD